ncbi:tetratricopeptide repeat protein [Herbidospora yilanensis]|uniref:tetratricopeptide repeat protein n=1 Tax=Herbidospora yilanensis TaxID=354426 RepID=UPI0012FB17CD|nr:tetratricopeptide repeat protein [Herbidospora yilanensis]
MLIDDVGSEESLREILAFDGPFALVCTSRSKLSGLTGTVRFLELGPLEEPQGAELVSAVAGPPRLTEEQIGRLVAACGGHPQALSIAAAHLASRPKAHADRYIADIDSADRGIKALRAGQTALEPILARSFAALGPEQRELFVRLGVLPRMSVTPDIAAAAVAPLTEIGEADIEAVGDLLDSLFELSLIEQVDDDRYLFHEILHRYARHTSAAVEPGTRDAVIARSCDVMALRAEATTESIGFLDAEARVPAPSNAMALQTLHADRPGAIALVERARELQIWEPLLRLVSGLLPSLTLGGHWLEFDRINRYALEAGELADRPDWVAIALHNRGTAASHLSGGEDATELFRRAAETARGARMPELAYTALLSMGTFLLNRGRTREAIPLLRFGLRFWRLSGDHQTLARVLELLGGAHLALGRGRRAGQYLRNGARLSASRGGPNPSNRPAPESAHEALLDIDRARAVGSREWEARALLELAAVPGDMRPPSTPDDPGENALAIYRDLGDVQGQVLALFLLGKAVGRAGTGEALDCLLECAELAEGIGDYQHAALALSEVAFHYGSMGNIQEADVLFADADAMARHLGNPVLIARILRQRADHLSHRGLVTERVDLLSEAIRLLETTDDKESLWQAKVALSETLVTGEDWLRGARILDAVLSAPSEHVTDESKTRAWKALAILYSRRGLHREAVSAITKALELCGRSGDQADLLHCTMARASLHARSGERLSALAEYAKAADIAAARKDIRVLLTAKSMAAVCGLDGDEAEATAALASVATLLPLAGELGMHELEAALRVNVGLHHSESGDTDAATAELQQALTVIDRAGDRSLRATALLGLARCHRAAGAIEVARARAREGFALHQELGNWSAAGTAYLELVELAGTAPEGLTFADILGEGVVLDPRVGESLGARLGDRGPTQEVGDHAQVADRRKITVSEAVRQELSHLTVEALMTHFEHSRQLCLICDLVVDETGAAELLVVRDQRESVITLRLAHPHCASSKVIEMTAVVAERPKEVLEAECMIFGPARAGVIIDCQNGWRAGPDGQINDVILQAFRDLGFACPIVGEVEGSPSLALPDARGGEVRARLESNLLTITVNAGELLPRMPLDFFPEWYQEAADTLTLIVGRNLQGMAADDPSYLMKAIALGRVVGGVVSLTVVRPGRNAPCPCGMRSGRKFKHCCGATRS